MIKDCHTWNSQIVNFLSGSFHALSNFFLLKAWSHLEQACGFSPQWVLSCTFNFFLIKASSHLEQASCFSTQQVLSCHSLFFATTLSCLVQANGLSPQWVFSCPFKLFFFTIFAYTYFSQTQLPASRIPKRRKTICL